ncbi:hypothetical protein FF011L_24550 [Roseimaritima multifibrata]|uniref:Histidine kinase n=1 Tax=Roseimaritima multifibrata TaxID=1930274 RepID=A0A517MFL8_9BACT|nr:hypothetical protein [Roseimaritima multifibrata]QDS93682.1 hypothetical protein FF011L_24550 [Roseimaritima multifibrata]
MVIPNPRYSLSDIEVLFASFAEDLDSPVFLVQPQPSAWIVAANTLGTTWLEKTGKEGNDSSGATELLTDLALGMDKHHHASNSNFAPQTIVTRSGATLQVRPASHTSEGPLWLVKVLEVEPLARTETAPTVEVNKQLFSVAAAHWNATFLHEIAQPAHVFVNIADILESYLDDNQLDPVVVRNLTETMQAAAEKACQCVAGLKQQLPAWESKLSEFDMRVLFENFCREWESTSQTLARSNETDETKWLIVADQQQVDLLLRLLHLLCQTVNTSDASKITEWELSADLNQVWITCRFAAPLHVPTQVLEASPEDLFAASARGAAETIAHGNGGGLTWLPVTSFPATGVTPPAADLAAGFQVQFPLVGSPRPAVTQRRIIRRSWH